MKNATMQCTVILILACTHSALCAETDSNSKQQRQIVAIMTAQAKAWNAHDIPGFMKHYWKSEKLTFSSGGTTRRGWQATMNGYKKKYPTPKKMGTLTFTNLEVSLLSPRVALVLGNWDLKRQEDEDLKGNFSLVFKKIDNRWLIVHDHSSALQDKSRNASG